MSGLLEEIIKKSSILPQQQQQEVLNFVEFLGKRLHTQKPATQNHDSQQIPSKPSDFYERVVQKYAGCIDSGHTDLSTNKAHMEGFGKE